MMLQGTNLAGSETLRSALTAITQNFQHATRRREDLNLRLSAVISSLRGERPAAAPTEVQYPAPGAGSLPNLEAIASHQALIDDSLDVMLTELESLLSA